MANKYLSDVPEDKVFWLSNGHKLRNLKDLRNALTSMPDEVFRHHADPNHNDFSSWIKEVIGDNDLSSSLIGSTNIHDHILKVNSRIMDLEGHGHKLPIISKKKSKAKKKAKTKSKKRRR